MRYPSPLSHSVPYFVSLAGSHDSSGIELPRKHARATESVRYPSPSSHSVPYSVSLAYPRGISGDALPRNSLRATLPGHFPSPLHLPVPHSVALTCSHGSSRQSARTHARRMMQNQNRNHQLVCGLAIIPTCVPLAQLDRASASGAEGRGFESHRGHHFSTMQSTKRAIS